MAIRCFVRPLLFHSWVQLPNLTQLFETTCCAPMSVQKGCEFFLMSFWSRFSFDVTFTSLRKLVEAWVWIFICLVASMAKVCWLLVVCCLLLVVGCWFLVVGCWLLVVGCLLFICCCLLFVVCCLLFVVCCLLFGVCCCCCCCCCCWCWCWCCCLLVSFLYTCFSLTMSV